MAISLLNNISALEAQNELSITQSKLQNTLFQLSSGSRINSGADDAAGLAIANGMQANMSALTQSQANANNGVGMLQVADGALAQVTTLLNRAITLATESANGTLNGDNGTQRTALDAEFTQIKAEIDSIGANTTFNGTQIFTSSTASQLNSASSALTQATTLKGSAGAGTDPIQLVLNVGGQTMTFNSSKGTPRPNCGDQFQRATANHRLQKPPGQLEHHGNLRGFAQRTRRNGFGGGHVQPSSDED